MNIQKIFQMLFYLLMVVLGVLTGCQQPTKAVLSSTSPSITPSRTSAPLLTPSRTPTPSPTLTPVIPTPTLGTGYQLTYVSECQTDSECMYAVDVSCLESEIPCLGKPQLLFEVSEISQGPKPPILYSSWSPDGTHVAIEAAGISGKSDVFVGDWDGKNWINLTNSPNFEGEPAWSPNGSYISFSANSGDPDYIVRAFTITPDGKQVNQLLKLLGSSDRNGLIWTPHRLSWSPDGEQVVFMHSDEKGFNQLFIANPDGSKLKQLTDQPENYFDPHFSPDGDWIVATRELDPLMETNRFEMILIRVDGSGEVKVILQSKYYLFQSVWSPNGNWIVFEVNPVGNFGIYLIRSDGTGLMKVTQSNVEEQAPAWRKISSP